MPSELAHIEGAICYSRGDPERKKGGPPGTVSRIHPLTNGVPVLQPS